MEVYGVFQLYKSLEEKKTGTMNWEGIELPFSQQSPLICDWRNYFFLPGPDQFLRLGEHTVQGLTSFPCELFEVLSISIQRTEPEPQDYKQESTD